MATLRRKDPSEQAFLEKILEHCREVGVSIRTKPAAQLGKRMKFSGWYISDDKVIWLARKNPRWFEILLHEYCHLLQDLEGTNAGWFQDRRQDWRWGAFDEWIRHERELSADQLTKTIRIIQASELDCDRRVVQLLKKHKFPTIDVESYARWSNAYAWSYEAARVVRKWSNKRRPYKVPEIHDIMPSRLIREDQLGSLPEGYLELFVRKCVDV